MATIGQMIKILRKEKGLTQKQLGEKIGVSAVTITRYETEQRYPDIETLKKIAVALETTVSAIVDDYPFKILKEHKDYLPKPIDELFDELLEQIGYPIINKHLDTLSVDDAYIEIYSTKDKKTIRINYLDYIKLYQHHVPNFITYFLWQHGKYSLDTDEKK